jgi:uncharacterized protein (TIGR02217 family)
MAAQWFRLWSSSIVNLIAQFAGKDDMPQTFPTLIGLQYDSKKIPVWSTDAVKMRSGKSQYRSNWSYPIYKFKLSFEFLRDDQTNLEMQTLMAFFHNLQGRFNYFYYRDPTDSIATLQQVGVGDGVTTNFPFVRAYGGYSEPVRHVQSLTQVRVNGAIAPAYTTGSSAGGYGVDTLIFFTPPPLGHVIDANFIFNYACRLTMDELEFNNFMQNFWDLQSIEFESQK